MARPNMISFTFSHFANQTIHIDYLYYVHLPLMKPEYILVYAHHINHQLHITANSSHV